MSKPLMMRYPEAADYSGLSVRQLRTAVHERRITFTKPSGPTGPTYFLAADLDAFVEACRQPAENGPAAMKRKK